VTMFCSRHQICSYATAPNFGRKTRGYSQKWHLRYRTSDISETKRSRASY